RTRLPTPARIATPILAEHVGKAFNNNATNPHSGTKLQDEPLALRRRRQLGHLLADDTHLLAVRRVVGESAHFLSHGSARAAAGCGFTQRRANGLRVVQALGAYDVERCGARIVESYVQRTSHGCNVARIVLRLTKAGVLLALDGLHPSSKGARVSFGATSPP
ncbi:MAG: hypothetical protein ACR2H2_15515, partial [Solirubrobacteraceae bacterium]